MSPHKRPTPKKERPANAEKVGQKRAAPSSNAMIHQAKRIRIDVDEVLSRIASADVARVSRQQTVKVSEKMEGILATLRDNPTDDDEMKETLATLEKCEGHMKLALSFVRALDPSKEDMDSGGASDLHGALKTAVSGGLKVHSDVVHALVLQQTLVKCISSRDLTSAAFLLGVEKHDDVISCGHILDSDFRSETQRSLVLHFMSSFDDMADMISAVQSCKPDKLTDLPLKAGLQDVLLVASATESMAPDKLKSALDRLRGKDNVLKAQFLKKPLGAALIAQGEELRSKILAHRLAAQQLADLTIPEPLEEEEFPDTFLTNTKAEIPRLQEWNKYKREVATILSNNSIDVGSDLLQDVRTRRDDAWEMIMKVTRVHVWDRLDKTVEPFLAMISSWSDTILAEEENPPQIELPKEFPEFADLAFPSTDFLQFNTFAKGPSLDSYNAGSALFSSIKQFVVEVLSGLGGEGGGGQMVLFEFGQFRSPAIADVAVVPGRDGGTVGER